MWEEEDIQTLACHQAGKDTQIPTCNHMALMGYRQGESTSPAESKLQDLQNTGQQQVTWRSPIGDTIVMVWQKPEASSQTNGILQWTFASEDIWTGKYSVGRTGTLQLLRWEALLVCYLIFFGWGGCKGRSQMQGNGERSGTGVHDVKLEGTNKTLKGWTKKTYHKKVRLLHLKQLFKARDT